MTELLTAAQMRMFEQSAIEAGTVTGLELMERAGRGVVEAVFEEWPELAQAPNRAVVLCGPGNNGGDGFVVARLLKAWGWEVETFLLGDPEMLPPDARANCDRWRDMGEISELTDDALEGYSEKYPETRLAVDALFGTGLTRPFLSLTGVQSELNRWRAASSYGTLPHVVSVEIASGVCADSGRYLGYKDEDPFDMAIMANLTVAFHTAKPGHFLAEGPRASGKLVVKSIGLEEAMRQNEGDRRRFIEVIRLVDGVSVTSLGKRTHSHKYRSGHALILSGGTGCTGAARLAARGALRIGAGLVTLGVPEEAYTEAACQNTAVMLCRVDDGKGLGEVLEDGRLNAVCLGPGLGTGRARHLVPEVLKASDSKPCLARSVVLDADALTAYENAAEKLFGMLHERCVLTPHEGEFARLFPDISEKLGEMPSTGPACAKTDAVRTAAERAGCVVLLKGPDTVIAGPDGRCSTNSAHYGRVAPWLATAGAGDVLTGFITGLLARGFQPFEAAETAAWLHVECACTFGPGLIAEDLPETLPGVFRRMGI